MPPTTRAAQPELSPCLRGTSNEVAEGVLLRTAFRYAHCRLLVVAELSKHFLLFQLLCFFSWKKLTSLAFRNPRGTIFDGATRDQLLQALPIACCSGVVKAFSAFSTPPLFQLEEIDKSCFSQPARHHLRRCDSRPIAASLVDYWLLH